ncbi:MAG: hypothetical protein Q8O15_11135 [Rectinemataceae bacterium]|nr:hypothetical protein [Rectinemataceae bacterium]
MKKILVLAFVLVAAIGAFAQTPALTFGMYGDITAAVASPDSYGIYTETYLAYKAKDMGLSATVVGGADFFAAPRNYSFWYQWCTGVKLYAGKLRETGSARLTSYIDGNGFSTRMANSQNGVMAYWNSVKNLTVAWFTPVTGVAIGNDFRGSSLGISFAVPSVVTLVTAYRSSLNLAPLDKNEFSLGADVKAIKDITLKAGLKNVGGIWSISGFFGPTNVLYATFGQTVGDMNYGVDADFTLTPTSAYGIKGLVEYTMGKYVLGAKASIDNGDAWYNNKGLVINPYVKRNFDAGDIVVGLSYNAATTSIELPVDFEISF